MFVSQSITSFSSFWSAITLYILQINALSIQMKVYIKRNNLQVEFKKIDFIHVYFCEARNSIQYRTPNANLDSGCQTVSIVTGDNGCRLLLGSHVADFVGNSIGALA